MGQLFNICEDLGCWDEILGKHMVGFTNLVESQRLRFGISWLEETFCRSNVEICKNTK